MPRRWLLALLLLVLGVGNVPFASAVAGDSAGSVKIRVPDGLYLFQPFLSDWFPSWKGQDMVRPLFLVERGVLRDPFLIAQRLGLSEFARTYLLNKTFQVYTGSRRIGTLRGVQLSSLDSNCSGSDFIPDLVGSGVYAGQPLPAEELTGPRSDVPVREAVRAVMTPSPLRGRGDTALYGVTKVDEQRLTAAARRVIVPKVLAELRQDLGARLQDEVPGTARLLTAQAMDLDGNHRKDLIGLYALNAELDPHTRGPLPNMLTLTILYAIRDTGAAEYVATAGTHRSRVVQFSFGVGLIDVDQDGEAELIIQGGAVGSPHDNGWIVSVLRHTRSGWAVIYRTQPLGCI